MPRQSSRTLAALATVLLAALATADDYDPLRLHDAVAASVTTIDLEVADPSRQRTLPLRVYLAALPEPAPVVLFSHGLGGSREGSSYLGRHWAARGYAAVFLQHPGSDASVWKEAPPGERLSALKKAASINQFRMRVGDVSTVIDQLEAWTASEDHPLSGLLDLENLGMSGHSFGAATTQAVSGQRFARGLFKPTEPRIDAALIMSPSSSKRGGGPKRAFAKVKIPWMLMTGTEDTSIIGSTTLADRLAVFPALPPGSKYELVLHEAQHLAFTDRLPRESEAARNPNHHRAILALSTAFWDAYLKGDEAAQAWLDREGPYEVLDPADRWQRK